jgi:hypothetical protein
MAAALPASASPSASQTGESPAVRAAKSRAVSFALFGDTPYGDAQIAAFPKSLQEITTSPGVTYAVHVGDIKNGSTRCDTSYFQWVRAQFDASRVPLIYTPGDNEWVDCHRPNNGAYSPLERLATLRQVMYTADGSPLGAGRMRVTTQAKQGLPENVEWETNGVEFATLNVQGSHNDLDVWTGLGKTAITPEQQAEFDHRMAVNVASITAQFKDARRSSATAVALVLQADMFDTYLADDPAAARKAFGPIIQAIAQGAKETGKPVYVLNGDSHSFKDVNPLAVGSPWLGVYGVEAVPNFTQVTVEGAATVHEFTKVTVQDRFLVKRGAAPLTFTRVAIG